MSTAQPFITQSPNVTINSKYSHVTQTKNLPATKIEYNKITDFYVGHLMSLTWIYLVFIYYYYIFIY